MKKQTLYLVAIILLIITALCIVVNEVRSQEKAKPDTTISVSVEKITAQILAKQSYIKAQRDTLTMIETMKKNVENDIMGVFYQIDALTKLKAEADTVTTKKGNKK